jgi:hypothetical protein
MTNSRRAPDVYVQTMTDGTATVAKVVVYTSEFKFQGAGSAHRLSTDVNDAELGDLLALKRAFESVVASLNAKTRRLIEVNDKKAREAENYKTKEEWEDEQRRASMAAHPAGKARKR